MTKWFGQSWGASVCDPAQHMDTPVGQTCTGWCREPILDGDQGVAIPGALEGGGWEMVYYHLNCFLRTIFGSVGHQLRKCVCFLSRDDPAAFDDPPGLTDREAANEAVALHGRNQWYSFKPFTEEEEA